MIGEAIDRFIGIFAPAVAARRIHARATMQQMQSYTSGLSGYQAGKINRLTKNWQAGNGNENAQPRADISRLRALSWDLYRNNSQAKKICRSLESKVIGRGLKPQSQAVFADGKPNVSFRTRAHDLWRALHERLDYRGRPGCGGQDFTELSKTALRSVILGGEVLYRFRNESQPADKLPPLSIQLVHADRLSDIPINAENNNVIFYGVELDPNDRRAAYHIWRYHPTDPRVLTATVSDVVRVPAADIGHLYIAEDVDQIRGTPWFSAALLKMRDTSDYEYNELKAAAVAACVVLGYRRSSGQSEFGLTTGDSDDMTDADGNKVTHIQPGMIVDLGRNGEMQSFNPARPTSNASEFIAHMLRSQATAVPGMKGSTLTGDFRNASFSSERSADNDVWPELEGLQDWFAGSFCQPIYERVILAAVQSGWFDGVDGFDLADFQQRKDDYLRCAWQGPVARSINPVDDAEAARKRIQNGISSPQREAALIGRNWQEIVMEIAEYIEFASSHDLPESIVSQTLGIDQQDDPMGTGADAADTDAAPRSLPNIAPQTNVDVRFPAQPAQTFNLRMPAVPANNISVSVPERESHVHVAPAEVTVNQAPSPDVVIHPADVNVAVHTTGAKNVTKRVQRDKDGLIDKTVETSIEGRKVIEVTERDDQGNIVEFTETRED